MTAVSKSPAKVKPKQQWKAPSSWKDTFQLIGEHMKCLWEDVMDLLAQRDEVTSVEGIGNALKMDRKLENEKDVGVALSLFAESMGILVDRWKEAGELAVEKSDASLQTDSETMDDVLVLRNRLEAMEKIFSEMEQKSEKLEAESLNLRHENAKLKSIPHEQTLHSLDVLRSQMTSKERKLRERDASSRDVSRQNVRLIRTIEEMVRRHQISMNDFVATRRRLQTLENENRILKREVESIGGSFRRELAIKSDTYFEQLRSLKRILALDEDARKRGAAAFLMKTIDEQRKRISSFEDAEAQWKERQSRSHSENLLLQEELREMSHRLEQIGVHSVEELKEEMEDLRRVNGPERVAALQEEIDHLNTELGFASSHVRDMEERAKKSFSRSLYRLPHSKGFTGRGEEDAHGQDEHSRSPSLENEIVRVLCKKLETQEGICRSLREEQDSLKVELRQKMEELEEMKQRDEDKDEEFRRVQERHREWMVRLGENERDAPIPLDHRSRVADVHRNTIAAESTGGVYEEDVVNQGSFDAKSLSERFSRVTWDPISPSHSKLKSSKEPKSPAGRVSWADDTMESHRKEEPITDSIPSQSRHGRDLMQMASSVSHSHDGFGDFGASSERFYTRMVDPTSSQTTASHFGEGEEDTDSDDLGADDENWVETF
eukprot:TRINITY_DN804_c0_g1_i2.p1 TRINITY_DN804_c0_g1~~TRINITY_DN804_c0_g1_i2.p1  ORF type:complete len:755 (+),score=264.71 TRINITY_DN804_c0_g1_i2:282-2267(+)